MNTLLYKAKYLARFALLSSISIICLTISTTAFAGATYTIRDNATGGDCIQMGGSWDANSKTCMFDGWEWIIKADDNEKFVEIADDNITFDCNGADLTDSEYETNSYGIYISDRTGVKIKDCKISYFSCGIGVYGNSNLIMDNRIKHHGSGFDDDDIDTFGLAIAGDNNLIVDNHINSFEAGFIWFFSYNTIVKRNDIRNNKWGFRVGGGNGNMIYNNNFIGNTNNGYIAGSGSVLNISLPFGGNYWDQYQFGSGCWDGDIDYICDNPYTPTNAQDVRDDYPWVISNGWTEIQFTFTNIADYLIDIIMSYELSPGSENSLISKVENAQKSYDKGNDLAAINQLEALNNSVKAHRGKKLTPRQVNEIIIFSNEAIMSIESTRMPDFDSRY